MFIYTINVYNFTKPSINVIITTFTTTHKCFHLRHFRYVCSKQSSEASDLFYNTGTSR